MRPYNPEERFFGSLPFSIIIVTIILFTFEKEIFSLIYTNNSIMSLFWWMVIGMGYPVICVIISIIIARSTPKNMGEM